MTWVSRGKKRRADSPVGPTFHYLLYVTVTPSGIFDPRALRLAIEFAGAGHVLAGSDYPHQIGSLEKMFSSIDALEISNADKAAILGGNAAKLLALD